jgi:hypothetical protein
MLNATGTEVTLHPLRNGAVQLLGGPGALEETEKMETQALDRLEEIRERVAALGGYL